jgi:hypothetical protein
VAEQPSGACAHRFRRVGRWPFTPKHKRWRCDLCGFLTRHYDSIDGRMGRPMHPHMSVACIGVNTVQKAGEVSG